MQRVRQPGPQRPRARDQGVRRRDHARLCSGGHALSREPRPRVARHTAGLARPSEQGPARRAGSQRNGGDRHAHSVSRVVAAERRGAQAVAKGDGPFWAGRAPVVAPRAGERVEEGGDPVAQCLPLDGPERADGLADRAPRARLTDAQVMEGSAVGAGHFGSGSTEKPQDPCAAGGRFLFRATRRRRAHAPTRKTPRGVTSSTADLNAPPRLRPPGSLPRAPG